jgi:hypothetical protein
MKKIYIELGRILPKYYEYPNIASKLYFIFEIKPRLITMLIFNNWTTLVIISVVYVSNLVGKN